jgi:hypothetical protein
MTKRLVLDDVPRIGWGQIDGRSPTDYSVPGCLGNIIGYIDACEGQTGNSPISIGSDVLDKLNQGFMNVSGISYATLWTDDYDCMVNELHRINYIDDIIDRCMRYAGRNYTYYDAVKSVSPEEWKEALLNSLHEGHPVLMESAAGIPEYSIITGYDDGGDTLIGWAYCMECAKATEPNGMFRAQVDWTKPCRRMVVVGGKRDIDLNDREITSYAIETMERVKSQDTSYKEFAAGFSALKKWHDAMADSSNELLNGRHNHFLHLMILNVAEPRAFFIGYAKDAARRYSHNPELASCFEAMVNSSLEISDYARAMWGVKDGNFSETEKRQKWCGLIRNCIDGDGRLLENLKRIVGLLA